MQAEKSKAHAAVPSCFQATMGPDDMLVIPAGYLVCTKTHHAMAAGVHKVMLPGPKSQEEIVAVDEGRKQRSKLVGKMTQVMSAQTTVSRPTGPVSAAARQENESIQTPTAVASENAANNALEAQAAAEAQAADEEEKEGKPTEEKTEEEAENVADTPAPAQGEPVDAEAEEAKKQTRSAAVEKMKAKVAAREQEKDSKSRGSGASAAGSALPPAAVEEAKKSGPVARPAHGPVAWVPGKKK